MKFSLLFIALTAVTSTSLAQSKLPNELPNQKSEEVNRPEGAVRVKPVDSTLLDPVDKRKAGTRDLETNMQGQDLPENTEGSLPLGRNNMFGVNAAIGIPHPLSVGLDYRSASRLFGASINAGSFSIKVSDVEASLQNQEIALRYFPWAGSFFAGLLAGQQSVKGKKSDTTSVPGQTITAEVNVKSNYLTPHVGWHWMWDSGFTLGMEVGVQSPISNSTDFTSNAPPGLAATSAEYAKTVKDVNDYGDKIGKQVFPYLTLLKIGWMF